MISWFSKLPYLGMKLGHWPKVPESGTYTLFLTHAGARNWANSRPAGSVFPRYWSICKICIFGHEFQKLPIYSLSTPKAMKLSLFLLYGQRFLRYRGEFSKLPYLGTKLGMWPKFQKLHVYKSNYSRVPNCTLFCSMIPRFPDNWGFWFLHRVQWWI